MRKLVFLNVLLFCSVGCIFLFQRAIEKDKPTILLYLLTSSINSRKNETKTITERNTQLKSILIEKAITGSKDDTCVPDPLPKLLPGQPRFADDLIGQGPFNFLENYRNPCFISANGKLNCLPYYYVVGAPKSGTTDLAKRIANHPEVTSKVVKEPHWLTRRRFYKKRYGRIEFYPRFTEYLNVFHKATFDIHRTTNSKQFHPIVVGDCSASTLFDNNHWQLLRENVNRTEPLYTNADVIHHLTSKAKLIAILRDPVERWFSDYLYFNNKNKSAENFHQIILSAIQDYKSCFSQCSHRFCLSNVESSTVTFRMYIGLYYYHLLEFYRVFPKEQIFVLTMEDYAGNRSQYLNEIYQFLGLAPLSKDEMDAVLKDDKVHNANTKKEDYGKMLPESRAVLEDFFKPHNEKLEQLLGRTLWRKDS